LFDSVLAVAGLPASEDRKSLWFVVPPIQRKRRDEHKRIYDIPKARVRPAIDDRVGSDSVMGSVRWNRDDVMHVMTGSSPLEQPQDTVNPVGRLDIAGTSAAAPTPELLRQQTFSPPTPPLTTQASNLFQSVVAFVGDGCGVILLFRSFRAKPNFASR